MPEKQRVRRRQSGVVPRCCTPRVPLQQHSPRQSEASHSLCGSRYEKGYLRIGGVAHESFVVARWEHHGCQFQASTVHNTDRPRYPLSQHQQIAGLTRVLVLVKRFIHNQLPAHAMSAPDIAVHAPTQSPALTFPYRQGFPSGTPVSCPCTPHSRQKSHHASNATQTGVC